jgi:hypothetical protein
MSVTHLTTPTRLIPDSEIYNLSRGPETGIARVRRLQSEARILAREQIEILCQELLDLSARAADIAEGGDAFPAGVRDMAERLAADLPGRAQSMLAIADRMAGGR